MEKRILFCNTAWMKYYSGKNDQDKPYNGGKYIKDIGTGGEIFNFLDDNGKCYGYVRVGGNMALQDHYKGVKAKDSYVEDVLVIWLATNKKKETRIVGWYKNAKVYRTVKETVFFTDQSTNIYHNIEANAMDCYLLPEEDRTFEIDRANEVGRGMGIGQSNIWYADSNHAKSNIVPAVIKYIEDYKGAYDNIVYQPEVIEQRIDSIEFLNDFNKLYEEGLKSYEEKDYYSALIYFKAAQRIDEPIDLLKKLAGALMLRFRYDEAIDMYNKIVNLEGETMDSLMSLMTCYDWNRDRERTIEYANKILEFPSDSYEEIENKRFAYLVIFDIYIYQRKFKKAEEMMNLLHNYLEDIANYSKEDLDSTLKEMKEVLERSINQLII